MPDFYLSPEKTGKPEEREIYVSEHPLPFVIQEMGKKAKKKFLSKE